MAQSGMCFIFIIPSIGFYICIFAVCAYMHTHTRTHTHTHAHTHTHTHTHTYIHTQMHEHTELLLALIAKVFWLCNIQLAAPFSWFDCI